MLEEQSRLLRWTVIVPQFAIWCFILDAAHAPLRINAADSAAATQTDKVEAPKWTPQVLKEQVARLIAEISDLRSSPVWRNQDSTPALDAKTAELARLVAMPVFRSLYLRCTLQRGQETVVPEALLDPLGNDEHGWGAEIDVDIDCDDQATRMLLDLVSFTRSFLAAGTVDGTATPSIRPRMPSDAACTPEALAHLGHEIATLYDDAMKNAIRLDQSAAAYADRYQHFLGLVDVVVTLLSNTSLYPCLRYCGAPPDTTTENASPSLPSTLPQQINELLMTIEDALYITPRDALPSHIQRVLDWKTRVAADAWSDYDALFEMHKFDQPSPKQLAAIDHSYKQYLGLRALAHYPLGLYASRGSGYDVEPALKAAHIIHTTLVTYLVQFITYQEQVSRGHFLGTISPKPLEALGYSISESVQCIYFAHESTTRLFTVATIATAIDRCSSQQASSHSPEMPPPRNELPPRGSVEQILHELNAAYNDVVYAWANAVLLSAQAHITKVTQELSGKTMEQLKTMLDADGSEAPALSHATGVLFSLMSQKAVGYLQSTLNQCRWSVCELRKVYAETDGQTWLRNRIGKLDIIAALRVPSQTICEIARLCDARLLKRPEISDMERSVVSHWLGDDSRNPCITFIRNEEVIELSNLIGDGIFDLSTWYMFVEQKFVNKKTYIITEYHWNVFAKECAEMPNADRKLPTREALEKAGSPGTDQPRPLTPQNMDQSTHGAIRQRRWVNEVAGGVAVLLVVFVALTVLYLIRHRNRSKPHTLHAEDGSSRAVPFIIDNKADHAIIQHDGSGHNPQQQDPWLYAASGH